ncbi:MAG: hypothetical protein LBN02_06845 [Oscillospiraceae bacterium]|jgi:hypothetical protein|nr:hypothetical protein [Oscillospiraceae bacterium]
MARNPQKPYKPNKSARGYDASVLPTPPRSVNRAAVIALLLCAFAVWIALFVLYVANVIPEAVMPITICAAWFATILGFAFRARTKLKNADALIAEGGQMLAPQAIAAAYTFRRRVKRLIIFDIAAAPIFAAGLVLLYNSDFRIILSYLPIILGAINRSALDNFENHGVIYLADGFVCGGSRVLYENVDYIIEKGQTISHSLVYTKVALFAGDVQVGHDIMLHEDYERLSKIMRERRRAKLNILP